MICSNCQATIADKAIVCYRCGAPTAIPAPEKRPLPETPGRRPLGSIVLVLLAVLLGIVSVASDPGTYIRLGAAIAAVVLFVGAVVLILRSRRG